MTQKSDAEANMNKTKSEVLNFNEHEALTKYW